MNPHKLSAFIFSAILVASQINFRAQAQEVLPKGIVFYKTSSAANSDTAQAREYQSLEPAPVVVNGISLEGAEFTIQRNRLVEVITYPNLRTIRTPAEIEALKEAGRKLTNAKSAYPLAATVIEPRLAAFTEVANKLNQGMVLVGGEWKNPASKTDNMSVGGSSIPVEPDPNRRNFVINGNEHSGKILRTEPDAVVLMTESGILRVSLKDQPVSIQEEFGYDPEKAKAFQAKREKEEEMRRNRLASAQLQKSLIRESKNYIAIVKKASDPEGLLVTKVSEVNTREHSDGGLIRSVSDEGFGDSVFLLVGASDKWLADGLAVEFRGILTEQNRSYSIGGAQATLGVIRYVAPPEKNAFWVFSGEKHRSHGSAIGTLIQYPIKLAPAHEQNIPVPSETVKTLSSKGVFFIAEISQVIEDVSGVIVNNLGLCEIGYKGIKGRRDPHNQLLTGISTSGLRDGQQIAFRAILHPEGYTYTTVGGAERTIQRLIFAGEANPSELVGSYLIVKSNR